MTVTEEAREEEKAATYLSYATDTKSEGLWHCLDGILARGLQKEGEHKSDMKEGQGEKSMF